MCGIAGKFEFSGAVVDRALISKMCDTIIYRGPDAEGIYTAPYIGLGQRRLSIIDLRDSANPPLSNEDDSVWIVFNGEIYNFKELRASLVEKGHVFRTATDTEVIVHLYEEYDTECVQHLRGMFAFAIWDSKKKRLFAARDRLGKKPFVYTKTNSSFVFGSEIKAITADPTVSISPSFRAIDSYLTYQYVPSPLTAFTGVFKLPPAHHLICNERGDVHVTRYWSPPSPEKSKASREEIAGEILVRLKESVRLRMVADVPLGAFLSGGIDSGAIVALMAMESSQPIKTFTIGFDEGEFSELPYARKVAERYHTDHYEFIVKPDIADILPLLVKHYNEPFADSSAVPTYYVSKMAREHVTVALSGDGGDENFAGYSHYAQTLEWSALDFIPRSVRKSIFGISEAVLNAMPYTNFTARAARGCHLIASQLPERYEAQISILKAQEKRACYSSNFLSLLRAEGESDYGVSLPWSTTANSMDWMMLHDQNFYLPDCLMVKSDVASMANSLELRAPLLDHTFIEFAATIPSTMKRDKNGGKRILREAVQGLLPDEILNKRKTGFGIPLAKWLRKELFETLQSMLLDDVARRRNLFKHDFLKKIINEHASGHRDWSTRLWALLFLELWFREFVD